jgi:hypothetical protein
MVEEDLELLYEAAWDVASDAERRELRLASRLGSEATASAIFTAIASSAGLIDPILTTYLWDELEPPRHITRIELGDLELSEPVCQAVQFALAFELGQRIDRAIETLGGVGNNTITQEELEMAAEAACVQWQVVSYALGRGDQQAHGSLI